MATKEKSLVEVTITPGSFSHMYSNLGRKPDLQPVRRDNGAGELEFWVQRESPISNNVTLVLRDDGTWFARAEIIV